MNVVKIRSKGSRLYNKGKGLRVPGFRRKGMFIGLGTMILGAGFIGLCFWILGVAFRLQVTGLAENRLRVLVVGCKSESARTSWEFLV
jgi:hypothetical protein